jgi:hypothetical protein
VSEALARFSGRHTLRASAPALPTPFPLKPPARLTPARPAPACPAPSPRPARSYGTLRGQLMIAPVVGVPGIGRFVDVRTAWLDEATEQGLDRGAQQVVVIAAGGRRGACMCARGPTAGRPGSRPPSFGLGGFVVTGGGGVHEL